jgi:[CysO sulfur-carrier protein]-S-L-cysteine hydrolase
MIGDAFQSLDDLITREALRRVYQHAGEEYSSECCGMILASGAVRTCQNAQDEFHAADPDGFPRTSEDGYCFSIPDQLFLADSLHGRDPVRIVYHSHPDVGAYFSRADHVAAVCGEMAVYPELLHLVIDVQRDGVHGARCFAFRNGSFREIARWGQSALLSQRDLMP